MKSQEQLLKERDELLMEALRRRETFDFHRIYPEEDLLEPDPNNPGQMRVAFYSRHAYPKHMEFLAAGRDYRQRCAMCGNRTGKTFGMGGFETATHLTGLYRPWWQGRVFARPVRAWAAGKTNETTRDIVQKTLLGKVEGSGPTKRLSGTGMIPAELIGEVSWKQGVADLVDTVEIRHATGGWSTLGLKSYQQGRGSFEGTEQDVIWLDEEPPEDVWGECLIRTMTTDGTVMLTFTPLEGVTGVVNQFMPTEEDAL